MISLGLTITRADIQPPVWVGRIRPGLGTVDQLQAVTPPGRHPTPRGLRCFTPYISKVLWFHLNILLCYKTDMTINVQPFPGQNK